MKKLTLLLFAGILSLISLAQPAFDDPCGAFPLIVQTGSTCTPSNPISWTGATATAGFPAAACGSYLTGDIWFLFIAPASGQVYINTAQGTGPGAITDGAMEVWGNPASCSTPSFFYVMCDDDSGPGLMPALSLTLTPGALYYIRFWDFYDATSGNIGGICVTDPNPPLATSGAVGIGIQNPDNLLDINGPLKIRGGNPGLNKVLTSDANGLASWQSSINPVAFKGTRFSDVSFPSGSPGIIVDFTVEEYDFGSVYNGFQTFTAPATGIYHFDAAVTWSLSGITSITTLTLAIVVSGTTVHAMQVKIPIGTTGLYSQLISADLSLSSSQPVTILAVQNSGVSQTILGYFGSLNYSYFNGHRIK